MGSGAARVGEPDRRLLQVEDTLRPLRRSVPEPCVYGFEYVGSEKPSLMVGTGSAVSPLLISACLRRATGVSAVPHT
jgi:hypothetical protein